MELREDVVHPPAPGGGRELVVLHQNQNLRMNAGRVNTEISEKHAPAGVCRCDAEVPSQRRRVREGHCGTARRVVVRCGAWSAHPPARHLREAVVPVHLVEVVRQHSGDEGAPPCLFVLRD